MTAQYVFHEKQYLGRDFNRISIRLVLALSCFAGYYITENRDRDGGDLLLFVGCGILIISLMMHFMLHYRTIVNNGSITMDGLWTTKLVKIDLNSIASVNKIVYSSYIINNAVYNLHRKGKIRFYAGGKYAIQLIDRDGLQYIIGTQKPDTFLQAIKEELKG